MTEDRSPETRDLLAEATQPTHTDSEEQTESLTENTPDQIQRERDEYHDLLLRKTAEFDNYRRRIERERENIKQAATAGLITELFPVIDDLERALEAKVNTNSVHAYREGVELIYKQLLDLLAKQGVTQIKTMGQDFDPNYHQAVAHEISPKHRDGQIIDEARRGYVMRGQLLRAAMVRVAKV